MECPDCGNNGSVKFEEVGNTDRVIQCQGCYFQGGPKEFELSRMSDLEKFQNWVGLGNNPDPNLFGDVMHPLPNYVLGQCVVLCLS